MCSAACLNFKTTCQPRISNCHELSLPMSGTDSPPLRTVLLVLHCKAAPVDLLETWKTSCNTLAALASLLQSKSGLADRSVFAFAVTDDVTRVRLRTYRPNHFLIEIAKQVPLRY